MEKSPANPAIPEDVKFIIDKQYKEVHAVNQETYFGKIKRGIDMLPIDDKFFKIIQSILKFFKFSSLILLKKPFETMTNDPQLSPQREADMKKIAKIAHDMIGGGGHIEELNFLFVKGIDQNFYKKIDIKEEKKKVIEYLKELSAAKKKLYKMIEDKTITQDDIMDFQCKNFGKDLMKLDELMENEIKICLKDVQAKFEQIQKQRKKKSKQAALQKQKQQRTMSQQLPTSNTQQTNTPTTQPQNLDDIMACCRRSFFHKQTIYQPESISFIYRYYNDYFRQQHHFDYLKTICGLLNSQGGYLFIGIKEDRNTYKKEAEGYTIIEKDKADFKKMVEELVEKCIQPTISHDILKIQFVPIKSAQTNKFISGKYIIKISVRYGQRKQFYSFKEYSDSKKQFFSVRTDTDTKIITSAQEILGIYRSRVLETPADPLPIHKGACPWPEVGRPLYELEELGNKK